MNIFISEVICHFSCKSDCKQEESVVSFMHEQNIICSQIQLDDIAHEHHMVDFQPLKSKKFFFIFFQCWWLNLKAFDGWRLCGRNFLQELKEILTPV